MYLSDIIPNKSKVAQFERKGIETTEELALYFPRKYNDYRTVTAIRDLVPEKMQVVRGYVESLYHPAAGRPAKVRVVDSNRDSMYISYFGSTYMFDKLVKGREYFFAGKISWFGNTPSMTNPVMQSETSAALRIAPVYSKIRGMSDEYLISSIREAVRHTIDDYDKNERSELAKTIGVCPFDTALWEIHNPSGDKELEAAKLRIDYEKIFDFYEGVKLNGTSKLASSIKPFKKDDKARKLIKNLPFPLTNGQKAAVKSLHDKFFSGMKVNSIISGDVGCGKTLVAVIAALFAAENGYQTILVAPTKILATQHLSSFRTYLSGLGVKVEGLFGDTKKKDRQKILDDLANGKVHVLIGTHAVLSPSITFKKLGLTITDEEQKFGTRQKELLETGDKASLHHVAMTATPIPRSMAKTLYTDDVEVIRIPDLPTGRVPIKTTYEENVYKAFDAVREEVEKGHKAYVVCPFIEDSDNETFKDVISLESALESFEQYLQMHPGFKPKTGSISGQLKSDEIDETVTDFAEGDTDILFSTSIVEVGVNVPKASMILIMNADRFGLSSLHQMRGRVGRSDIASYCVLQAPSKTERIDIMVRETNGFIIAEKDMQLRGPGQILGLAQTGESKEIDAIIRNPSLAIRIKEFVFKTNYQIRTGNVSFTASFDMFAPGGIRIDAASHGKKEDVTELLQALVEYAQAALNERKELNG